MAFLQHQQRILNWLGYDFQSRESRGQRLFIAVNLVLMHAIMFAELAYVIANFDHIQRATDGLCPLLFGISSSARLMTLCLRRDRFAVLMASLRRMWSLESDARARDILQAAFERENRLSFPYILSTILVGVLYLAFPLCRAFYQQWSGQGDDANWEIPMRSMYAKRVCYTLAAVLFH